ncbi:putative metalloprotease CJM1_0395 family protein [Halomonas sp. AOP43-D1-4]|uniref:putative metalloprotease CJM1_0395 family protein n=1 Tax=Halomonas sp. AOP43-D1-4 TaxID=3457658 RepID=UPI0040345EE9
MGYLTGDEAAVPTRPDGKKYAVAREVPIDYGPILGDSQATIKKMQTVIATPKPQRLWKLCKRLPIGS